jgi:hypothetical protein
MGLTRPNLTQNPVSGLGSLSPIFSKNCNNLRVDNPCNIGASNPAVVPIWLALFKFGQAMN